MPPRKKSVKKENSTVRKITVHSEPHDPIDSNHQASSDVPINNFAALYSRGRDRATDMTRIDRHDPNRKKKIIAWVTVLFIIIIAAVLGGFYFFVYQEDKFSGDQIDFSLKFTDIVSSGEITTFIIEVANNEEVDLLQAELTVRWPTDFIFDSSDPQSINEANNAWQLGTIKSGKNKSVKISGKFLGAIGTIKEITALLSYLPSNFNSEFQSTETFSVAIGASILDLSIKTPVNIISGLPSEYTISVTNKSSDLLDNVSLILKLPIDLEVSDFDPEPDKVGITRWDFEELAGGEQKTIKFTGSLIADIGVMREIGVEAGYIDGAGRYNKQVEETTIIFVVNPQLNLTLSLNDGDNAVVSFGDTLNYELQYNNDSQSVVRNLKLTVVLTGEVLDWKNIVDTNNGTVSDGSITWDSTSIEALKLVKPGDEGSIQFSIPLLKNKSADDSSDGNYIIDSQALAVASGEDDSSEGSLEIKSESISTSVNSRLDLKSEARYYSDEFLEVGSGPVPPEIGEETTYQIYWYLTNTSNVVNNITVTATLPDDIVWADDFVMTAGSMIYDESTRTVTWTINKIPQHVGQFIAELEARFSVSVTPTDSDLGNLLILMNKSTVQGQDNFTEESLSLTQDLITSDLSTDPLAVGKGIVVESSTPTNANENTNSL